MPSSKRSATSRLPWRRLRAAALAALPLLALGLAGASAQNVSFFRIGTGSTAGTYFPIGGIIASAISSPPGSRDCKGGGSCGVSGLVAVAQSTRAAVDNARQIQQGTLESGFVQSDLAYWTYHGEDLFLTGGPLKSLTAIPHLSSRQVPVWGTRGL